MSQQENMTQRSLVQEELLHKHVDHVSRIWTGALTIMVLVSYFGFGGVTSAQTATYLILGISMARTIYVHSLRLSSHITGLAKGVQKVQTDTEFSQIVNKNFP